MAKDETKKKAKKSGGGTRDVEFDFERDTKNKRRFSEVVEDGEEEAIGTLYVSKSLFDGELPDSMVLTMKWPR